MKFSYSLLKQLAPKIPSKEALIEKLNFHAFEAEDIPAVQGGVSDMLEISIPANRYSDASSHWGIARIAAALFGGSVTDLSAGRDPKVELKNTAPEIKISAKKTCNRYIGRYIEVPAVKSSPEWLRNILLACGQRPINSVVDVMNYVMLEVGQPLHAFDANLVKGPIEVRMAQEGETIRTIDGADHKLNSNHLVIADSQGPLAIAGVKGGKRAEVTQDTRKIIVEAASFDGPSIYKTSRDLNLFTDASGRFSHGLSPMLAEVAMKRATVLLKDEAKAKIGDITDVNYAKFAKRLLKFDIKRFNQLTGLELEEKNALGYLKKLGFKITGRFVEIPAWRMDVSIFEDLVEEVVNLYGYQKLESKAPHVPIKAAHKEDQVVLKDKLRDVLSGFGLSEVYNYTFLSRQDLTKYADPKWFGAPALLNPVSADFQYLRPNLTVSLVKNINDNFRFFNSVKIFEVGKVFSERDSELKEEMRLGVALGSKSENPILELKGLMDEVLKSVGLVDFFFRELDWELKYLEQEKSLRIEVNHEVLGYIGIPKGAHNMAVAEVYMEKLLKLVEEEKEYEPLSKYPSVDRDISLLVNQETRVDKLMEAMENAAPQFLDDVDLIDYYDPSVENKNTKKDHKSLTFRLVFQADDHTLTDEEVNAEMVKITSVLQDKFGAEIR